MATLTATRRWRTKPRKQLSYSTIKSPVRNGRAFWFRRLALAKKRLMISEREYEAYCSLRLVTVTSLMPNSLRLIVHFVIHILVASFLFGVVTFAAFALWTFTQWLKGLGAPDEIWFVSYAVSELVFWIDVLCFGVFVLAEVYKLIREILANARKA